MRIPDELSTLPVIGSGQPVIYEALLALIPVALYTLHRFDCARR